MALASSRLDLKTIYARARSEGGSEFSPPVPFTNGGKKLSKDVKRKAYRKCNTKGG